MQLSVSDARARLGQLVTLVQDPRLPIVLTRHGKPVAALVSMEEVKRIWELQDDEWFGARSPLTGRRRGGGLYLSRGLVMGPEGKPVTVTQAAQIIRERQMTRAEERAMLAAGGLKPVEGGEVAVEIPERVEQAEPKRRWWRFW
ncbi:type II toxin-antitoxin system Phd/YefM family antitoxin [Aestuariivita boseongensis]|uniref:type II toxin-antitoxin system Phd/YefM family antitoxin n=1 Tax=Aestuariivita boseongensis TaxID=1470562 RepID=UPI000682A79D|nr:type II toxin-antitoxin system Phd/YefM family antitoxin [Aestuariivita boseongensis]